MKPRLADEIGINSARVFGISVLSLLASGAILGVVWGGRAIQTLEKPAERVFLMALATGALSGAGVFAAAYISEGIGRNESESEPSQPEPDVRDEKWEEELELERERSAFLRAGREHQENYLKAQIEEKDRTIKQLRSEFSSLRREFLELRDIRVHLDNVRTLDNRYNILDCYGCKHFYGKEDEGKYFVCAMHPYGHKDCPDREGLKG